MKQAVQLTESAAGKIQAQYNKLTGGNKQMSASLNELRSRLEAVNNVRFSTRYAAEFRAATREAQRLENQIAKLEGRGRSGGLGMLGGLGLGFGAFELGRSTVGAAATREQQKISFEVMTGSKDTGNKLLNDLVQMGAKTPFESADLIKNAELLKAYSVETNKIIPTLTMLGDVSRGNAEKLGLLSLAYAQASANGRLMGQDLLQMVNAGFNPLQQMVKDKVFPNMMAAKKAMEQGAVSAQMLEAAFQSATGPGGQFYMMMEKQSLTIAGRWSTFLDNAKMKLLSLGEAVMPVVSMLLNFGNALLTAEPYAISIAVAIGALATAIWGSTAATYAQSTAMAVLNAVMRANPIFLVISLVAALAAGIIYAYNHIKEFRGFVTGAWEGLKMFGTVIKDYVINRVKDMVSGIKGLGETLMYFFKGDWKKAWETGKQATKDLLGIDAGMKAFEDAKKIGSAAKAGYVKGAAEIAIKNAKTAGAGTTTAAAATQLAKPDYGSPIANQKAESVNSGGQRSIKIEIGKQIEKLEIHVVGGAKEAAQEVETAVQEVMRRVFLTLNAQTS